MTVVARERTGQVAAALAHACMERVGMLHVLLEHAVVPSNSDRSKNEVVATMLWRSTARKGALSLTRDVA